MIAYLLDLTTWWKKREPNKRAKNSKKKIFLDCWRPRGGKIGTQQMVVAAVPRKTRADLQKLSHGHKISRLANITRELDRLRERSTAREVGFNPTRRYTHRNATTEVSSKTIPHNSSLTQFLFQHKDHSRSCGRSTCGGRDSRCRQRSWTVEARKSQPRQKEGPFKGEFCVCRVINQC